MFGDLLQFIVRAHGNSAINFSACRALQADMPFLFIECVGLLRIRMLDAGPRLIYLLFKLRARSPRARRTHLILLHAAYLHLSHEMDHSCVRRSGDFSTACSLSVAIYHTSCFAASLSIIVAQQYCIVRPANYL